MKCPQCGGRMKVFGRRPFFDIYDSQGKRIASVRAYECERCGEIIFRKVD